MFQNHLLTSSLHTTIPSSPLPAHRDLNKNTSENTNMAEPTSKKQRVLTQYEKLAAVTTIVADTGEIAQIKKFMPTDATTNPSLIYKASSAPEHQDLVNDALAYGRALEGVFACFACRVGGSKAETGLSVSGYQSSICRQRRDMVG